MSASPAQGRSGDRITLQGSGFSFIPPENIIVIGDTATSASSYEINASGEEVVSFDLPESVNTGATTLLVIVQNHSSNALPFTLEP